MERRYFDWAATSPPDPIPPIGPYGNPSSRHLEGRLARAALDSARARCAAVLAVSPEHLFFTSGGTEADSIILQSLLARPVPAGAVVSAVEHPAVLENARVLPRLGHGLALVGPAADGRIEPAALARTVADNPEARLVAVMAVNNETGAVMDVGALVAAGREAAGSRGKALHFHCDAVQAAGKTPLDLRAWDVDSAALSGHKIGGPRGIGLLYLRKKIEPLAVGGGQEGGIRSGTENVAGALALAAALERHASPSVVAAQYAAAEERCARLLDRLRRMDRAVLIPEGRADQDARFSPYIVQIAFRGVPGEVMVRALDDAGFAVSTGSACSSASAKRPVLEAMGVDEKTAFQAIRISQGWSTTMDDLEALIEAIQRILHVL